ncbi:MAG: pyridoxal phosphate-dependent aminotransferase [Fastidiosipilaceae bacterium]|jgi:aminotransferase|nr:aminotransferase class I/II-fold pyridoxal phosphate-dependent enzyme [Clostridiaceae bacterium]
MIGRHNETNGLPKDSANEPITRLSSRVNSIEPSGIRRFFDLANELKGEVLSLSIGEPDFVTPWRVREMGIYSLEQGYTHYTANQGLMALRNTISEYTEEKYNLTYDPKTEIVVTVGGSEALDDAIRALIDPGDEVIIPEPCFVSYKASVGLANAVSVPISLKKENQFKLTPEELEAAITPKTRLLILGFPNNPTGAIMDQSDIEALLPVLRKHPQISIVSDELYAQLTYGEARHFSIANVPDMQDRTVIVGGFSKAFAMTGWRIGYALAHKDIAQAINKIHQFVIMSAPTTAQYAAIEALRNCDSEVEKMVNEYNYRRRYIYRRLLEMGIECFEPLGAFYIFPDISRFGMDSNTFCERLLQEQKVAIIPGSAFGNCGEGHVRISYAAAFETIEAAMNRLENFISSL